MHFFSTIPKLLALATFLGHAAADVEIRFYHNNYACTGSDYAYWYNIPANTCYKSGPGDNAVHAVEFFNVPGGAKGQVYTSVSSCSTYGAEGGSGTYCLNGAFYYNANWFYSSKKLAKRDTLPDSPPISGFQYATRDGETRRISCAPEDFGTVRGLVENGDYAALARYPTG